MGNRLINKPTLHIGRVIHLNPVIVLQGDAVVRPAHHDLGRAAVIDGQSTGAGSDGLGDIDRTAATFTDDLHGYLVGCVGGVAIHSAYENKPVEYGSGSGGVGEVLEGAYERGAGAS